MIEVYKYKVILSGAITEIYGYETEKEKFVKSEEEIEREVISKLNARTNPKTGEIKEPRKLLFEIMAEEEKKKRDAEQYKRLPANVQQTKMKFRRLIDANVGQYDEMEKFLTLTFNRDVSREEAMREFKTFIQRMKYYYPNVSFKYVGVIELQKSGRIHFHIIFFGLPYVRQRELDRIWSNGRVDIRAVHDYKDLSGYVVKYISKTLGTMNFIPKYKKFYVCSKDLLKPNEIYVNDENEILDILEDAGSEVCSLGFHSEYVGQVQYSKYQKLRCIDWDQLDL